MHTCKFAIPATYTCTYIYSPQNKEYTCKLVNGTLYISSTMADLLQLSHPCILIDINLHVIGSNRSAFTLQWRAGDAALR